MGDELITIEDLLGNDYEASQVHQDAVPTVSYSNNFKRPSYNVDGTDEVKDRDTYIQEWNAANPMPEKPAAVAAKQEEKPSYEELLKAYEQQPQESANKARRASMIIAGIGDAISSIAQLVSAYNGGSYAAPKNTLTGSLRERYDKLDKAQKEDREKYRAMLLKRAQLMQRDYQARQKANDTQATATNKANQTAYDNATKARNAQLNSDLGGLERARSAKNTSDYRTQQQENFNKSYNQRAQQHKDNMGKKTKTVKTYQNPYTGEQMQSESTTSRV